MSAHWKPLTEGIYFDIGQRTVCELVDGEPDLTYHDLLDDILYLASTVSIIHHRKQADYADRASLLAAERVRKWGEELRKRSAK